jgi:hypothetical protein
MYFNPKAYQSLPLGVVLRRSRGVTRWQPWAWSASAVLPGAAEAHWHELRSENGATEYHAATLSLELHGADAEAYLHGLTALEPSIYIVMREGGADAPLDILLVTASPYEAQDYCDSGEEIVEKVPMPPALLAFVQDFVDTHYKEEAFKKRKRDKKRIDLSQDGIGDPRIGKAGDIYASPAQLKRRLQ